ncbi:hypothetical protein Tco_1313696 [Tanacetum coccineum]
MAEQRDKSLNSLVSAASLHISETKVILSKSLYALSCSSFEPRYGSSSRINCLTCDVIFCGSSAIASRAEYASRNTTMFDVNFLTVIDSHLDITSDHRPGSAGNTSITLDSFHASGRVYCEL